MIPNSHHLLKGQKIKTHDGYTKKVQGFGKSALDHTFPFEGKTINVVNYFKNVKKITLK